MVRASPLLEHYSLALVHTNEYVVYPLLLAKSYKVWIHREVEDVELWCFPIWPRLPLQNIMSYLLEILEKIDMINKIITSWINKLKIITSISYVDSEVDISKTSTPNFPYKSVFSSDYELRSRCRGDASHGCLFKERGYKNIPVTLFN